MRRLLARRALPLALMFALAAMAAVALAQVGGAPRARAAAISGSGSFRVGNSREGAPIFSATGIAPGGAAVGTVTIEDTGSGPIALVLHRGELVDSPGPGGGVLSERLRLTVIDVTDPSAPQTVYSGPLATMPDRPAGELAGGEARTYRFTATLSDEGSASFQNAVQGAATTVAYSWIATEANGGGEKVGSESGGGSSTGTGSTPPGGGGGAREGQALKLKVPQVRRAIRGGRLVVWTTCDLTCRLSVRGRIRATAAGRHRGSRIRFVRKGFAGPGPQRLRIPIPRGLRRWLATAPGRTRVRARLRILAIGIAGERSAVRRTVRLRAVRTAPSPNPGQTPPQTGSG